MNCQDFSAAVFSIWVKMLRLKKYIVKIMETHGNRSKIGKGGQDCMAIIYWRSQTRWCGNMSKKGKIEK